MERFHFTEVTEESGGDCLKYSSRAAVGSWYLLLWYVPGDLHHANPIPIFILQTVGVSILYTWIYNNTDGNLLLSIIFHVANNMTLGILPFLPAVTGGDPTALYISIGLLWFVAATVTIAFAPTYLSRNEKYNFLGGFSWDYDD